MAKLPAWNSGQPTWIDNGSGVMVPAWSGDACACCEDNTLPGCCARSSLDSVTVSVGGVVGAGLCNCSSINASFTADRTGACQWSEDITSLFPVCAPSGQPTICVSPATFDCEGCDFTDGIVTVEVVGSTATATIRLGLGPSTFAWRISGSKSVTNCDDIFGSYGSIVIASNGLGQICPSLCTDGGSLTLVVS